MDELLLAQEGFSALSDSTKELYELLSQVHGTTVDLLSDIEGSVWKGKAASALKAFLTLTKQYHQQLLMSPLDHRNTALIELNNELSGFLGEFSEYNKLP